MGCEVVGNRAGDDCGRQAAARARIGSEGPRGCVTGHGGKACQEGHALACSSADRALESGVALAGLLCTCGTRRASRRQAG